MPKTIKPKILRYDPPDKEGLSLFEIRDPDLLEDNPDTTNGYCIGFIYKGGDPLDLNNWAYDHANYWDSDSNPRSQPLDVSRDVVETVLGKYSSSLETLLKQYIKKVRRSIIKEQEKEMKEPSKA